MRKWKPSSKQRREFAIRMQTDSVFAAEYESRKNAREAKRRAGSEYDYATAGGYYIPTEQQYNYAMNMLQTSSLDWKTEDALNQVVYGYSCREKIPHDCIHVVNEMIRDYKTN